MRLCGKMNDPVDFEIIEPAEHRILFGDITPNKPVAVRMGFFHVGEIGEISRIGEKIHVDDLNILNPVENMSDKIAADKTAAPCNESSHGLTRVLLTSTPLLHFPIFMIL